MTFNKTIYQLQIEVNTLQNQLIKEILERHKLEAKLDRNIKDMWKYMSDIRCQE